MKNTHPKITRPFIQKPVAKYDMPFMFEAFHNALFWLE